MCLIGPAVRHAAAELAGQPQRKKLLLVLTDGKPNDVDHYEGRFAVEDTRKAVREARRQGIAVFGVTVFGAAQSYFPAPFGGGCYAIVGNIRRLSAIHRQLVQCGRRTGRHSEIAAYASHGLATSSENRALAFAKVHVPPEGGGEGVLFAFVTASPDSHRDYLDYCPLTLSAQREGHASPGRIRLGNLVQRAG